MKNRWYLIFSVLVMTASLVLTACEGAGDSANGVKTEVGKGEGDYLLPTSFDENQKRLDL